MNKDRLKSYNTLLSNSNRYFLNTKNIYSIVEKSNVFKNTLKTNTSPNKVIKEEKINTIDSNFFTPSYKDTLFWCWIIFYNGFIDYNLSETYHYSYEKKTKIELINKLRESKKILKTYKLKLSEIENNLLYEEVIDLNTFYAILSVFSFNFVYMDDKIIYEKINYPNNKTCYILKNKGLYSLWSSSDNLDITNYKKKLFEIDNIKKPIKSISSYKAIDLKNICKKLNIDIMKTPKKCKTKKELYQLLLEIF